MFKAGLNMADLKKRVGWEVPQMLLSLPGPILYIVLGQSCPVRELCVTREQYEDDRCVFYLRTDTHVCSVAACRNLGYCTVVNNDRGVQRLLYQQPQHTLHHLPYPGRISLLPPSLPPARPRFLSLSLSRPPSFPFPPSLFPSLSLYLPCPHPLPPRRVRRDTLAAFFSVQVSESRRV